MSAVLRALPIVLFWVAVHGVTALEAINGITSDAVVFADSQRLDRVTLLLRPRAGVSALRQSLREGGTLTGSTAVPPPAETCAVVRPSPVIYARTHLPFCVTPRPPPPFVR